MASTRSVIRSAGSTTAGFGRTLYSSPEIMIAAAQPRPYSPIGLFEASGPLAVGFETAHGEPSYVSPTKSHFVAIFPV